MFGSNGIDAFHSRQNTQFLTTGAYHKVFLLHIAFRAQHETCNLEIGETEHFRFAQHVGRNIFHLIILREFILIVYDVLQLAEEPRVNLRQFKDTVDCVAFFQSLGDGEHTQVGGVRQFVIQIIEFHIVIAHKAVHTLTYHTQTFLDNLLERAADRHDFAHRLHA